MKNLEDLAVRVVGSKVQDEYVKAVASAVVREVKQLKEAYCTEKVQVQ